MGAVQLQRAQGRGDEAQDIIRFELVAPERVYAIFGHIEDWVLQSIGEDRSYTPEDICRECAAGAWDLRLIYIDGELTGFFISAFNDAPKGKTCYGAWLGGKDLQDWAAKGYEFIKDWARENGCIAYFFIGRDYWKRFIKPDYTATYYYVNL